MSSPKHIKNIHDLQRMAGAEPMEHPSFLLVRLEDIPPLPEDFPREVSYGFYSMGLKRNLNGYIRYGRRQYDFQEGILGFTAPGQVVGYDPDIVEGASGWQLFFHTELLSRHPLADIIQRYGFFDYQVNEALHLSQREEQQIESIMENLHEEYHKSIDKYSKGIMLSNLELLFTYADRFYARQFITRNEVDSSFLSRFDKEIKRYFQEERLIETGIPSVGYFADFMNVSKNYLSDLLKELTGTTTQEHIHFHLIEKAKNLLFASDRSIAEIAHELGFEHPPYFTRLFKDKTGQTPKEFRSAN